MNGGQQHADQQHQEIDFHRITNFRTAPLHPENASIKRWSAKRVPDTSGMVTFKLISRGGETRVSKPADTP